VNEKLWDVEDDIRRCEALQVARRISPSTDWHLSIASLSVT
jgi:hypothetical protein